MLSLNPTLTASEIRAILHNTCDKVGGVTYTAGTHPQYGYGRVNAAKAVESALPSLSAGDVIINEGPSGSTPMKPQLAGVPHDWIPSPGAINPDGWRYIVIHHSATPAGGAKAFDRMHREKGWDELGYHFVIGNGTDTSDGQIEVGSRWPKQKWGAHAKTPDNRFNKTGIGICLVGNFDTQRPTRAELQSVSRLVAYLMKTYHIPADHVIGHSDTKATDCPGHNLHVAEVRRMAVQLATGIDPGEETAKTAGGEMLVDLPQK